LRLETACFALPESPSTEPKNSLFAVQNQKKTYDQGLAHSKSVGMGFQRMNKRRFLTASKDDGNEARGLRLTCWTFCGWRKTMKRILVCAAILGVALSSAAQAKGCIKGAIVGSVAGHMAGHGKIGAAAGCAIGHHEANKPGAQTPASQNVNAPKTANSPK
jgi:hypothetical protein